MELFFVVVVILTALVFDYINGFHDAANSIATVVSTRVLSPGHAVIWAAFFNFVAAFVFGTAVARTVGSGMVDISIVTTSIILAGLTGAIIWDLITWYYGLPTSSSHALIGGYAGAAVAKVGMVALIPSGWTKTLIFIVLAPGFGFLLGFTFMVIVFWICRGLPPSRVDKHFRKLQLVSAAAYSLGHGGNDAQKTMGIIAGALFAGGCCRSSRFRSGWYSRPMPRSRSARSPGAGASFTRWVRRSRDCSRWAALQRRPQVRYRCSLPRDSVCP